MPLNKSNGDMYEWVTHTWNPLCGDCSHECVYCYVGPMKSKPVIANKYGGEPRIHQTEITTILGKHNFIFVCNMTDLFASNVPTKCIIKILEHIHTHPLNTYLLQTKNPVRAIHILKNFKPLFSTHTPEIVLATTIETDIYPIHVSNAPSPEERIKAIQKYDGRKTITIEPIIKFNLERLLDMIYGTRPEWVSIGADSGNNNLPEPAQEEIQELILYLETFTKVIKKKNLKRLLNKLE